MKKISDLELKKINGGGFSIGIALGVGAGVTFLVGMIDGLFRPLKCR